MAFYTLSSEQLIFIKEVVNFLSNGIFFKIIKVILLFEQDYVEI